MLHACAPTAQVRYGMIWPIATRICGSTANNPQPAIVSNIMHVTVANYIHIQMCMYVCIYIYIYIFVHVHMFVRLFIYIYTTQKKHTNTRKRTCAILPTVLGPFPGFACESSSSSLDKPPGWLSSVINLQKWRVIDAKTNIYIYIRIYNCSREMLNKASPAIWIWKLLWRQVFLVEK